MRLEITVLGAGYVGLVTSACFAELGHIVTCVDVNIQKITNLKMNILPFYESHLESLLKINVAHNRLHFECSLQVLRTHPEIIFIAVDTAHVIQAAIDIGQYLTNDGIIVVKSTVPIGMTEYIGKIIQAELDKRNLSLTIDMLANPESLREGTAIVDFMHPDRVIIGLDSEHAKAILRQLYSPIMLDPNKIYFMRFKEAEMTKYTANAMLATRISFMNEIAMLCEEFYIDVEKVRMGIGSDKRIGDLYLHPGCGYGGSCFPKDVNNLIHLAEERGISPVVLRAVAARNDLQKRKLVQKILTRFGEDLSEITIGMWGLSFKPGTDDMREAPSWILLEDLIAHGARVLAHDPVTISKAAQLLPLEWLKLEKLRLVENPYAALENVDALILATEWSSYGNPDFDLMKKKMRCRIIFDGRNLYDPQTLIAQGFEYFGIGRGMSACFSVLA